MSTDNTDARLTSKFLAKEVEKTLHCIKERSERPCGCRLRVAGIPYLGTSCVERDYVSSLPWKEKQKERIMSVRPGIWRGELKWAIRCDVFSRDVLPIVEEEFIRLIERVGDINFLISVH